MFCLAILFASSASLMTSSPVVLPQFYGQTLLKYKKFDPRTGSIVLVFILVTTLLPDAAITFTRKHAIHTPSGVHMHKHRFLVAKSFHDKKHDVYF